MIHVQHLYHDYPGCRALDDVGFDLPAGSITALVGPNGAGKTTLLRALAGLDDPMAGQIVIDGIDVRAEPRQAHLRMGYLPDHFGLYQELTAERCLRHAAAAHGVNKRQISETVIWAAQQVGLSEQLAVQAGTLSRGQRQRLALAQAIVHKPKVLLLDEPGSGLDPEARSNLSILMKNLAANGMTLLISSHILAELETYCTAMLVLQKGRLLTHQRLGEDDAMTQTAVTPRTLCLRLAQTQLQRMPDLLVWLQARGCSAQQQDAATLLLETPPDDDAQLHLLRDLLGAGWPILEYRQQTQSLQDVYLETVSAPARKEKSS